MKDKAIKHSEKAKKNCVWRTLRSDKVGQRAEVNWLGRDEREAWGAAQQPPGQGSGRLHGDTAQIPQLSSVRLIQRLFFWQMSLEKG